MSSGALKLGGTILGAGAIGMGVGAASSAGDAAAAAVNLTIRNYYDTVLPSWERTRDYYDRYVASFAPYEVTYLAQAQSLITYTPDFSTQESRAVAGVSTRFSRLRQKRNRNRLKYNYGLCCHENLHLDIAESIAITEMINRGYRFEVERKERLDEWYWNRQTQGMSMVEAMRSHAIGGLMKAVASSTAGVSATANAANAQVGAAKAQMSAFSELGSSFFSMGNGAAASQGFFAGAGAVAPPLPF